jgi:hypothetical protein
MLQKGQRGFVGGKDRFFVFSCPMNHISELFIVCVASVLCFVSKSVRSHQLGVSHFFFYAVFLFVEEEEYFLKKNWTKSSKKLKFTDAMNDTAHVSPVQPGMK